MSRFVPADLPKTLVFFILKFARAGPKRPQILNLAGPGRPAKLGQISVMLAALLQARPQQKREGKSPCLVPLPGRVSLPDVFFTPQPMTLHRRSRLLLLAFACFYSLCSLLEDLLACTVHMKIPGFARFNRMCSLAQCTYRYPDLLAFRGCARLHSVLQCTAL